jgi:hypothetical protein
MNKENKKVFKYNEDDILEILLECLAKENEFELYSSKGLLLGTPGKDLRLVAVVGELEDESVDVLDLDEIDRNMDFNGTHPPTYSWPSRELKKDS